MLGSALVDRAQGMRGGASVTRSTPDALWSAPELGLLRPAAVSCSNLRRRRLLDGLSLSIPVGMRLLIVSDPEASASALLRILAGLSRSSRGRVRIAGLDDPSSSGWGRRVAYLGPQPGIRSWMTPRETLALAAALVDLAPGDATRRIELALDWVRIDAGAADRPLRHGGPPLLERTGLAAALIGDPEVLLLDEPLRAIDAEERTRLLRLPGSRRTILLASRYPASEAGLVSHVALVQRGRLAMLAAIDELERAGLPLSTRGIETLAASRGTAPSPSRTAPTAAGIR
jgi:ABC-2 type transport system ATP-binding protein